MMLYDNIAHHPKFLLAGQLIGGPAGASRALALWVAAIGYARAGLTNGVVHDAFLTSFGLDSDAKRVVNALVSRKVRLFHRVKGGYKIHDFLEHNGSAAKLRRQRELAKARKRRQRAREAVENEKGAVENSDREDARHDVTRNVPRDDQRDSRARVMETERYVRTSERPSSSVPVEVPKKEQRPAGRATQTTEEEHERRRTAARAPAADGNYAVLEKLAHTVLEELHTADPESPEVVETLKVKCAALAINYHSNPNIVRRALVSAATQRVRAVVPRVERPLESVASIARRVTIPSRARR